MEKIQNQSGIATTFKDVNGQVIKIHDYVKDGDGKKYYINSHCQAVPDGEDAPVVELARLVEESTVTVMSPKEVLEVEPAGEGRRRGRGGKKAAKTPEEAAEAAKAAEARAAAAAAAANGGEQDLHPVTQQMLLSVFTDDVLAQELRRRGYTLCAFRPAIVEL